MEHDAKAKPSSPTIANFAVTPTSIDAGQSVVLSATVTNTKRVTLDGIVIQLPYTDTPQASRTYQLYALGTGNTPPAVSPAIAVTVAQSIEPPGIIPPIEPPIDPPIIEPPPVGTAPKTIMHAWINERWLADTLDRWANSGLGGFMIAGQTAWFTPAQDLETYNRQSFTDLNTKGAAYGITDNFFVVSLAGQNWSDGSHLYAWHDDAGWDSWLAGGLSMLTNFARTTGCKGIVLDTEVGGSAYRLWTISDPRNQGASAATVKSLVYKRGQQTMNAMQAAYPNIQIWLIQEGALWASGNDVSYELWPDFYNGLASVQQTKIVLGAESTYPEDPLLGSLNANPTAFMQGQIGPLNSSMTMYSPNWATQGHLACGMRPLGVDYDNKAARYTPAIFAEQLAAARAASGNKYVWVYSHGSAWYQMTQAEVDQYSNNPWHYTNDPANVVKPVDPNINNYFSVLKG